LLTHSRPFPPPRKHNKPSAVVVTLVATAIVPLALKPGDDAAQKVRGRRIPAAARVGQRALSAVAAT